MLAGRLHGCQHSDELPVWSRLAPTGALAWGFSLNRYLMSVGKTKSSGCPVGRSLKNPRRPLLGPPAVGWLYQLHSP